MVLGEALHDGECEGGGFAGAGLSDAEQIGTRQHDRDGLLLDGGGDCVAFFG